MTSFSPRTPSIAQMPVPARPGAPVTDRGQPAREWAGREDLSECSDNELRLVHAALLTDEAVLRPYWSLGRVAYKRVHAELLRRMDNA